MTYTNIVEMTFNERKDLLITKLVYAQSAIRSDRKNFALDYLDECLEIADSIEGSVEELDFS
tara:strand:- start:2859 stop:3044 length:186 start_codon:yes stop_codon:yes gene_type:complete